MVSRAAAGGITFQFNQRFEADLFASRSISRSRSRRVRNREAQHASERGCVAATERIRRL